MAIPKQRLGDILVSQRLITQQQLDAALDVQAKTNAPLGAILVSSGFITESLLLRAVAAQMGVTPWFCEKDAPQPAAVKLLPPEVCRNHQVLPVRLRGDLLTVAMLHPWDIETLDLIRNLTKKRIEPAVANAEKLAKAIDEATSPFAQNKRIDSLVTLAVKEAGSKKTAEEEPLQACLTEEDTRPVVGLVNTILADAIRMNASDVHIEPRHNRVEVRYRIDGELQKVREVPSSILPMLATRLKIMAELDIVEYRLPQDGRVEVGIDGRDIDLRLSVLPNNFGQRFVLRILDRGFSLKKMGELGLSAEKTPLFKSLIERPYGLVLVTGPTGSGKTTTLYAALREIMKGTNNVMTAEDPVEYQIDGISQSQVHEKIGMTFGTELRAILRQDPDVILVGEIRDQETAETSIRAALTGHLVLSTLHCNDAPSAVPRLLDMGINPYLLSTCLAGATSQRLMRKLCTHCREKAPMNQTHEEFLADYGHLSAHPHAYVAKGCPKCFETGFKGRLAVHEIMPVTPEVSSAIANCAPMPEIRAKAARFGYEPLQIEAARRVLEGKTTLAEATRHVFFDTIKSVDEGDFLRVLELTKAA